MKDKRKTPRPALIVDEIAYIPLGINAKDGYALVDGDMAWLADKHKWVLDSYKRYAVTGTYEHEGIRMNLTLLHRVIMGIPKSGMVDHISRDKLDNRRSNLRIVDARTNSLNRAHRGGTSKYRGVCWDKRNKKWIAKLKSHGKDINFGLFTDEKEAAQAYNIGAIEHFGDDASLNEL